MHDSKQNARLMFWQSKDTALVYNMTYSDIYDFFSKRSRRSQVYPLMFGSQKIPVYCHMENFGCGGGGWTLAMKINGAKVKSLPSKNPLMLLKLKKKRKQKIENWVPCLSENLPLWFPLLEQQKCPSSYWRQDWLWLTGDQITNLLEYTLQQDLPWHEDWSSTQVYFD